jgi:signal transduction histidine kinase
VAGLRGETIVLPEPAPGVQLAFYDTSARLVAGAGPALGSTEVKDALRGRISDDHDGAWLAVAVPLQDEQEIVGAARAASPWSDVTDQTNRSWLLMSGFALAAIALAGALAAWQSSRLVAPMQDAAALALRLGDGDFTARLGLSGVPELDRAADALNRTAGRLGDLIARERAFTSDVSHQLSTPLTSLRLGLEGALVAPGEDPTATIERALVEVDRLQTTVATLLAVARDAFPVGGDCDVTVVCMEIAERCRGELASAGRSLKTALEPGLPRVRFSEGALREILAVLVDNARRHGAGTVTIAARRVGSGVVVDVGDEGEGIRTDAAEIFRRRSPEASGHGLGLALARSLAEAHGARLAVTRISPQPIFSVALAGVTAVQL